MGVAQAVVLGSISSTEFYSSGGVSEVFSLRVITKSVVIAAAGAGGAYGCGRLHGVLRPLMFGHVCSGRHQRECDDGIEDLRRGTFPGRVRRSGEFC
jgi:hypothetical protein